VKFVIIKRNEELHIFIAMGSFMYGIFVVTHTHTCSWWSKRCLYCDPFILYYLSL